MPSPYPGRPTPWPVRPHLGPEHSPARLFRGTSTHRVSVPAHDMPSTLSYTPLRDSLPSEPLLMRTLRWCMMLLGGCPDNPHHISMQIPTYNEPLRSALFVDFDNIFLGLRNDYGDKTANYFATNPNRWLDWMSRISNDGISSDISRRMILRKCYLNPASFSRFRIDFVRAAFEVVDCPSLTAQGKVLQIFTWCLIS